MLPPDLPQRRGGGGRRGGGRMKLQQPGLRLGIAAFRSSATQESGPASGRNPAAASGAGGGGEGGSAAPQRGPGSGGGGEGRGGANKKNPPPGKGETGAAGCPGRGGRWRRRGDGGKFKGERSSGGGGAVPGGNGCSATGPPTPTPPPQRFTGQGPRSQPGRRFPVTAARRGAGRQHPRRRGSLAAAAPASRPGPAGTCPGCLLPSPGRREWGGGGKPAALPAY